MAKRPRCDLPRHTSRHLCWCRQSLVSLTRRRDAAANACCDARQEPQRSLPEDRRALFVAERRGAPHLLAAANREVAPQIWEVGSEENLAHSNDRPKKLQNGIALRQRGVPVEPAEGVSGGPAAIPTRDHAHLVDDGEA